MRPRLNLLPERARLSAAAVRLPDLDPLELLERLRPEECPVFLDSAGPPRELARYSCLAWQPFAALRCRDGRSEVSLAEGREIPYPDHPLEALRHLFRRFALDRSGVSLPFAGGGIGWFAYDLGRWIERLPAAPADDLRFPDLWFGLYDSLVAWDHAKGEALACACEWEGGRSLQESVAEVERVLARPGRVSAPASVRNLRADHTRESYAEAVRRAKEHIFAGDIYQVNLSQRFDAEAEGPALAIYRRLRECNPAPFAAFLSTPEGEVLSSSPELFLRIDGRRVETRPIKGTRPRFGEAEADERARGELLASEKDRAELTMIIDLERNDLHRVCETGTVRVPRLYGLEEYATVFHLVSTVEGTLREGIDVADCLRAAFPGGSITGAPKIRAMEIISQLERSARSVYSGSIGWIGFDGDAALNIAIRTLLRAGDRLSFRLGGGIVADSDPDAEYEETLHKGRGILRALEGLM